MLAINFDIGNIVFKYGGDVDLRNAVSTSAFEIFLSLIAVKDVCRHFDRIIAPKHVGLRWHKSPLLTSGKVPFEKTLSDKAGQ